MTNAMDSRKFPFRKKFSNSTHDNDRANVPCNSGLLINSAIYRVEVMLRECLPKYNHWETFIFTEFEQAARFTRRIDVVKSRIFFQPKKCSNAIRRMYPISNVIAYVDVSGWTFHVFVCGKNCMDKDDTCCKFKTLATRPKQIT